MKITWALLLLIIPFCLKSQIYLTGVAEEFSLQRPVLVLRDEVKQEADAHNSPVVDGSTAILFSFAHSTASEWRFLTGLGYGRSHYGIWINGDRKPSPCFNGRSGIFRIEYSSLRLPLLVERSLAVNEKLSVDPSLGILLDYNHSFYYNTDYFIACLIGYPDANEALRRLQLSGSANLKFHYNLKNTWSLYAGFSAAYGLRPIINYYDEFTPNHFIYKTHAFVPGIVVGIRINFPENIIDSFREKDFQPQEDFGR